MASMVYQLSHGLLKEFHANPVEVIKDIKGHGASAIRIAFTSSIYLIWLERNNRLHGADNSHKEVILSNILHTIRSRCIFLRLDSQNSSRDLAFSKAFNLPLFRSQKPTKSCKWVHPEPGCVKLNCDASLASSSASIGGLLRTNDGSVLAMYSQDKIQMTIQELELEAICHGASLASSLNIDRLWIESDSLFAVNVIEGSVACPWKKRLSLAHLKNTLLKFVSWKVSHIWREANQPADFLSKADCPLKGSLPHPLYDYVKEDDEGTLYYRL
ncbi:uncharacterized protein LOC143875936 [Tasmannia lanceolata]|uniref:uncharacterized protein LOC143875936 n=1 Tax=Tasmannia lanceolata TaxID=3420 RepID=UPI0040642048